jgi:hypothetical protein
MPRRRARQDLSCPVGNYFGWRGTSAMGELAEATRGSRTGTCCRRFGCVTGLLLLSICWFALGARGLVFVLHDKLSLARRTNRDSHLEARALATSSVACLAMLSSLPPVVSHPTAIAQSTPERRNRGYTRQRHLGGCGHLSYKSDHSYVARALAHRARQVPNRIDWGARALRVVGCTGCTSGTCCIGCTGCRHAGSTCCTWCRHAGSARSSCR